LKPLFLVGIPNSNFNNKFQENYLSIYIYIYIYSQVFFYFYGSFSIQAIMLKFANLAGYKVCKIDFIVTDLLYFLTLEFKTGHLICYF